jgi:hypothetical protein
MTGSVMFRILLMNPRSAGPPMFAVGGDGREVRDSGDEDHKSDSLSDSFDYHRDLIAFDGTGT